MPVIAIYGPVIDRSPSAKPPHHEEGDSGLKRLIVRVFTALIISFLHIIIFPNILKSQISNDLCFETLTVRFLENQALTYKSVEGFTTPMLLGKLHPMSNSNYVLEIAEPELTYENLKGPFFIRSMEVSFTFRDSTDHEYAVSQRDTLHRKSIRTARKSEFKKLRGADPRFLPKIFLPALIVAAGISGIISLFYIRSA